MVPAFVGLGAPHWDASARGAIVGITRGTTRADIVRATLDSIAYQVRDVLVAMESDTGHPMSELRADGGATANRYLMQFQADILGKPVRRAKIAETTAMGAAMLAGLAMGVWKTPQDLRAMVAGGDRFQARKCRPPSVNDCSPDGMTRSRARSRKHPIESRYPEPMPENENPIVTALYPEQHEQAAQSLGRAFIHDPTFKAIIPDITDPVARAEHLAELFRAMLAIQRRTRTAGLRRGR